MTRRNMYRGAKGKRNNITTQMNSSRTGAFEIRTKNVRAYDSLHKPKELTLEDLIEKIEEQQQQIEIQQRILERYEGLLSYDIGKLTKAEKSPLSKSTNNRKTGESNVQDKNMETGEPGT